MKRRSLFPCIAFALAFIISTGRADAATYVVSPDGGGDFPTIQAAVNAASNGDIIELTDGFFTGNGNRDIQISTPLTLRAQSGPTGLCIIDCEAHSGDPHFGIDIDDNASGTVLEGISIQNAWVLNEGGAIRLYESSATFDSCIFYNNYAELAGGAISAITDGWATCTNSLFAGNRTNQYGAGGAIYLDDASYAELTGCTFNANWGDMGGMLYCGGTSASYIYQCTVNASDGPMSNAAIWSVDYSQVEAENTIISFGTDIAAYCSNHGSVDLDCCDVYGNDGGDWVGCIAGQLGQNGNMSRDPLYCWPHGAPFSLHENSPCAPGQSGGCGLIGHWPVGCGPAQYLLSPGGNGDYPTIQAALDDAPAGSLIELADGTYSGNGNRDLDFHGKAMTLRSESGNPEMCVIDAGGSLADPHRAIWFDNGERPTTIIQEIGFIGGYAGEYELPGGAIYCGPGSAPQIFGCRFEGNETYFYGGAVALEESAARIESCTFELNRADGPSGGGWGGAVYAEDSECLIIGSEFTENYSSHHGGAVLANRGSLDLHDCVFRNNDAESMGGAVSGANQAAISAEDCSFELNQAGSAGGASSGGNYSGPHIYRNCTFTGNSSFRGGAVRVSQVNHLFEGCTFYTNEAEIEGGAIMLAVDGCSAEIIGCTFGHNLTLGGGGAITCGTGVHAEIRNTIIAFGIVGNAISTIQSGTAALTCTDIYGNAGGDWDGDIAGQLGQNGNITQDPLFCWTANPDAPYSLQGDSPCIGTDCGLMGAWPVGCPVTDAPSQEVIASRMQLAQPSPNPFHGRTHLSFTVPGVSETRVSLQIYDLHGRSVCSLIDHVCAVGTHEVAWDGRDRTGHDVPSGIYYAKLNIHGETQTRNFVLAR